MNNISESKKAALEILGKDKVSLTRELVKVEQMRDKMSHALLHGQAVQGEDLTGMRNTLVFLLDKEIERIEEEINQALV